MDDQLVPVLVVSLAVLVFALVRQIRTLAVQGQSSTAPLDTGSALWTHVSLAGARDSASRRPSSSVSDLTFQLQVIASLQITEARRRRIDLHGRSGKLRALQAAWIYGAGVALAQARGDSHKVGKRTASALLQRRFGFSDVSADQYYEAITCGSDTLCCYRLGLEAAEHWLDHSFVPCGRGLCHALETNALV